MNKDYSKEVLMAALSRIEKKYPASFTHFILAEIDPELYKQFMDNLGKDNDSERNT